MSASLDPFALTSRVAIVTGGGTHGDGVGTGRAAAIRLAQYGARVLVVDRDSEAAHGTVALIKGDGAEAAAFVGDLAAPETCEAMANRAFELWGRIDILNNNLGVAAAGSVITATQEDWHRALNLNLLTAVNSCRFVLPFMTAHGGGSVINISSMGAIRPSGAVPYSTSKGALISLTQALAVDHATDRIRVNCILPGPIYTPMVVATGVDEERRAGRRNSTLLDIEGDAWDVANAVLFFASDAARFVTGSVFPVDGGVSLKSSPR